MTPELVPAAAQPLPAPAGAPYVPLTARMAARLAGEGSPVVDRVTEAADTVPSASAFQSAL
ncbi:hypothetical protein GCM10010331_54030 [Streptomyces xanthochromogenes]|uniref:hypothetical protein n=1 Tax=Streptomyces xanthochromogenes TaxID=67384 RepID=UPI00167B19A8|nr:hypothetical protein [Streptomyces xanthochromogenes]GHB59309.1 hypothetical protein GCM10010331_54030 [Streptomyces xanthochromogenes]